MKSNKYSTYVWKICAGSAFRRGMDNKWGTFLVCTSFRSGNVILFAFDHSMDELILFASWLTYILSYPCRTTYLPKANINPFLFAFALALPNIFNPLFLVVELFYRRTHLKSSESSSSISKRAFKCLPHVVLWGKKAQLSWNFIHVFILFFSYYFCSHRCDMTFSSVL